MRPFSRITVGENLRVFDHVTIRVSDLAASRSFYLEARGLPDVDSFYVEWGDFSIVADGPPTERLHVAFGVDGRDAVDGWWERMTHAGYESDGEPGPRPQYSPTYYGAFVLDPDGNSVEAVHHERANVGGMDHLWLRTRDVAAARAFYERAAPAVGWRLVYDSPDRVRFADGEGSVSFVHDDEPTRNVHLAFGAPDRATVERFHRTLLDAGYRDNGGPGERPRYHPGYYGAFVLDPDDHNVEAVFHDR
jgi:catechol 2,3-dioxygenase-like lactoylglutathione lyase family enzyme